MPHGFATRAIHEGQAPDPATGAVAVPIYQTSTFAQSEVGVHQGYEYARTGNPTRAAYETALASLEGGTWGLAFASGMAATASLLYLLRRADGRHLGGPRTKPFHGLRREVGKALRETRAAS